MTKDKIDILHIEEAVSDSYIDKFPNYENVAINEDARQATDHEHTLTLREAFKSHKPAILWSMVLSATIIMEGYDNILMSSFFAYPSFQKKYGVDIGNGEYQLLTRWQTALGTAPNVGTILGVFANGYLTERFGHRRVIMVSLIFMCAFIFIPFFAPSVEVLLAGQILCGLPWGVFATMGPTYSSEVCPMALRGYLTAYVNMCWAIGQFIAAGVLKALVANTTEWSYRIPFAIQWVWPIPLFILTWAAPDSPWWLIRKGRFEDAEKSIKRLGSKSVQHKAHQAMALMIQTNELEQRQEKLTKEEVKGLKSYLKCFQGSNLRRTEIACIAFAGQVLSGSTFAYSPSYFFSQAGLNSSDTYKLNLGVTGIAFTGTFCSWFLLKRFGRRTIYVSGYFTLVVMLFLIGILAVPAENNPNVRWAQAALTLIWVATYALTIGPLAFTIVSEMSATRLRAQSVALARNAYNLASLISNVIEPYLITTTGANLKGKTAFVWFATALPTLIWSYFRLPETKDRTYEELDILFEKGILARKFSSYVLDTGATGLKSEKVNEAKLT
mmetsp:Transcript_5247/g.5956  ORF Transcript_5247/g.5956 Transcript_5247/m.5956 type:complete len:555 (+) Transcript_5247:764-2428(+)